MPGVSDWRRAIFEPSDSSGDLLVGLAAALLQDTALPGLARTFDEARFAQLLHQTPENAVDFLRHEMSAMAGNDPNGPNRVTSWFC